MDSMLRHKIVALSSVTALGPGTYGAQGMTNVLSMYHLVHTAALVKAPITKHPTIFGGLRLSEFYRFLQPSHLMDPMLWHKVAALSGVAALGLGTYGAHGFKPKNPTYKDVWQTASLYHLVHTAALVGAPITKHPTIFGGLLTTGILAFSGTCYTVAYLEDRKYSSLAPFGGFAFIAAWASLLF